MIKFILVQPAVRPNRFVLVGTDNVNIQHTNSSSLSKLPTGIPDKYHERLSRQNISTPPACSELPLPFVENLLREIYVPYEEFLVVSTKGKGRKKTSKKDVVNDNRAWWASQRLDELVKFVSSDPAKHCGAISRLVRDGLKCNLFGIDFSDVIQKRGLLWTMDEDIKVTMQMYWGIRFKKANLKTVQVDYELRYRPRDMNMFVYGPRDRFSNFFHDGYVKITDFGVDINRLKEEMRIAKGSNRWEDLHESSLSFMENVPFNALNPLINNKAILELVSFYMGSDVVVNGYQYWHAHANATKHGVPTSTWHHDSCGTRVKLFVYLHDVDEGRLVTEIAAGSQTTMKYTFSGWTNCMFKTETIKQNWKVDRMIGPAGGGFLFDPNTMHRGFMEKPQLARDVVVIDMSSAVKAELAIPKSGTCPIRSWRTKDVSAGFKYPEKTRGPVTAELLKQNNATKAVPVPNN